MKFNVATRTDITSTEGGQAKLATLDISTSHKMNDITASIKVQPAGPVVNKNGVVVSKDIPNIDLTFQTAVQGCDAFAYLDNVNKGFGAPRLTVKKSVTMGGQKVGLEVTGAMKGNTSVLPKNKPLDTNVLTVQASTKVSDVNTSLKYGTLTKMANLELKGKAADAALSLKVDCNTTNRDVAWKATASYPMPEGIMASADINNKMGGVLSLSKSMSGANYTLEAPYTTSAGPNMQKAALKVKYNTSFSV